MICEIWMLAILGLLCVMASISDLQDGKIYNKHLCYGAIVGSIGVIWYYYLHQYLLIPFILNFLLEIMVAFLFFKVKIWGAGDAKFWILICFLYPFGRYYTYDYLLLPSLYILMFIFIIAYVYVLVDTLYIKSKQDKKQTGQIKKVRELSFGKIIKSFAFHFFFIRIIYRICMLVFREYYYANSILFVLLGMIVSLYVQKRAINRKMKACVIILGMMLMGFDFIIAFSSATIRGINIFAFAVTVIVLLLRDEMTKYNYQLIPTESVQTGMILSYPTIIDFSKSRVSGLPQFTDESTKYRISQAEADAIKRWKTSKYGKESVLIVKFIPFGVFMAMGVFTYFIWNIWWG